MKNIYYIVAVGLVGALGLFGYYNGSAEIPKANPINKQKVVVDQTIDKKDIPSNWKTYTNERIGISFQYPNTWIKNGEEYNATNLAGTVIAININFIDTISHTALLLQYHLAPNGAMIYEDVLSQFNASTGRFSKDSKKIVVSGINAVESFNTMSIGPKGEVISPTLRTIIVDFLDKQQTGEFEFQFKTPLNNNEESEVNKFNQLLSSFKFIN